MRHAQDEFGLEAHEYELFLKIKASIASPGNIDWYGGMKKSLIDWARTQDLVVMNRLIGFESPKSLVFFESVLLETNDRAIRTDYLLRHYNETDAPGKNYNEDDFQGFLEEEPFMDVVKVNDGGVSMISPKKQDAARKKHFGQ